MGDPSKLDEGFPQWHHRHCIVDIGTVNNTPFDGGVIERRHRVF